MGKRQAAKDVTHALLLTAARTLFATKGYEAVNMREIATMSGRSTGSIFANFSGKAALFEAAMGRPVPDVEGFLRTLSSGALSGLTAASYAQRLARDLYGPDDA